MNNIIIIQKVPNQEKKFAKMHRSIVFCTSNRVISWQTHYNSTTNP